MNLEYLIPQRLSSPGNASNKCNDTKKAERFFKERGIKFLENPQVIKTPVVRNGKQSTLGYQPDIWKGWN